MNADRQPEPGPAHPLTVRLDDRGLVRIALVAGLLFACYTFLRPFLAPLVWAIILAVSGWPAFRRARGWFGDRTGLAATLFCLIGITILMLPLIIAGVSATHYMPTIFKTLQGYEQHGLPGPPEQVGALPIVGPSLARIWSEASAKGSAVLAQYESEIRGTVRWVLMRAGSFTLTLVEFTVAIVVATLFLANAERLVVFLRAIARKIAGEEGAELLPFMERTIRAVSFGVVGTALIEGTISAVGYAIAGVTGSVLLGVATFLCCILQVGPGLVFLPATAWVWWHEGVGWGLFVLAWSAFLVLPVEMFGKPAFISRDTGLPMSLIFVGVVGGLIASGFIGIFLGATILAVTYTLAMRWLGLDQAKAQNGSSR